MKDDSMPTQTAEKPRVEDSTGAKKLGRVTIRCVLLAVALTVVNDFWIVQLEVVRYSFATYAAPFYNCIFTLLVVTSVNMLVRKWFPRIALSRVELLTIYVMVSVSSAVCSHNMMEILVSLMGYAHFFKSPENQWGTMFLDRLPAWLTVSDANSLRHFYYGNPSSWTELYRPENYVPWIVPALCWSSFCAVLLFTMLCINSILRKQWIEAERLTFPIVMLPLEMTQESGALFKNKYMWLGFTISGVITLVAGLHYLYPSIPYIRIVRQDLGQYFSTPPWNGIGGLSLAFYFWAIGVAFLMPLELSLSTWFFFFMLKLELMFCTMAGLNQLSVAGGGFGNTYPFVSSQSYGAYLGFFAMTMWTSRRYLGRVWRTAFMGTKEEDESNEPISYRTAILGVVFGTLFLAVFAYAIGMSRWVIAIFFLFYFIFAVIISRIRAELGFPIHDMHGASPTYLLLTTFGTDKLPTQDMVGFSLFFWFNRTYASHPSPHQLEAYKIGERTNAPARQMFFAVLIAGILAMPIGFWMLLHNYYHYGGATARMEMWAMAFGRDCWSMLGGWMQSHNPPNTTAMTFVGVGFVNSLLIGWMRVRCLWFPFHPLAYAIAGSWGVYQLWMPILIGWTCKFMVLRFGGLKTYRSALPFFYGLILGEIAIGSLWTIVGIAMGIQTYDFWPGKYN